MLRILRTNPAFYCMTGKMNFCLSVRKRGSCRNKYHLFHQIDSGYCFCYGMLHLNTRVHLHKIKILLIIHKKLNGTGAEITGCLCRTHRCPSHFSARLLFKESRRCLFNHFLMTALNRTVTVSELDHIPILISEYLKFNMVCSAQKLLHIHPSIPEGLYCLLLCHCKQFRKNFL